jgi:methanogenic corrinoid protein MtbC1
VTVPPSLLPAAIKRHPIAVVAERTGLTQDLLRIWERRYGAVTPDRGPDDKRLYSDEDVERLRLLDAAVRGGRRIGNVASLDTTALAGLVHGDLAAGRPPSASDQPDPALIGAMMAAIRAFDSRAFDDQLRRAAALLGVPRFLESVLAPLLREVGDQWHEGRLTVAQEHFASSAVADMVSQAMRSVSAPNHAPRLLVTTLPESRHVIGAILAGAMAATDGWHVIFLGAELSPSDIISAATTSDADAVALSVTFTPDPGGTVDQIRHLRHALPPSVLLIVGGSAIQAVAKDVAASGIPVGATLEDLRQGLRGVARRGPAPRQAPPAHEGRQLA